MKPHVADAAITACLTGMARLIRQADRVARRSVETAANDRQKAVTLTLDVEPWRQRKESDSAAA